MHLLQQGWVMRFLPTIVSRMREYHSGETAERQSAINAIQVFQKLSEAALSMRARAIHLLELLHEKLDRNEPLTGQDLLMLNHGASAMLDQRAALLKMGHQHECWLEQPIPPDPKSAEICGHCHVAVGGIGTLRQLHFSDFPLPLHMVLRRHLNSADKGFELREGELNGSPCHLLRQITHTG